MLVRILGEIFFLRYVFFVLVEECSFKVYQFSSRFSKRKLPLGKINLTVSMLCLTFGLMYRDVGYIWKEFLLVVST